MLIAVLVIVGLLVAVALVSYRVFAALLLDEYVSGERKEL
jgi:hypothetical protein